MHSRRALGRRDTPVAWRRADGSQAKRGLADTRAWFRRDLSGGQGRRDKTFDASIGGDSARARAAAFRLDADAGLCHGPFTAGRRRAGPGLRRGKHRHEDLDLRCARARLARADGARRGGAACSAGCALRISVGSRLFGALGLVLAVITVCAACQAVLIRKRRRAACSLLRSAPLDWVHVRRQRSSARGPNSPGGCAAPGNI